MIFGRYLDPTLTTQSGSPGADREEGRPRSSRQIPAAQSSSSAARVAIPTTPSEVTVDRPTGTVTPLAAAPPVTGK
jgi:hypothetical protein